MDTTEDQIPPYSIVEPSDYVSGGLVFLMLTILSTPLINTQYDVIIVILLLISVSQFLISVVWMAYNRVAGSIIKVNYE